MKKIDPISTALIVGILAVGLLLVRAWDEHQMALMAELDRQTTLPAAAATFAEIPAATEIDLPAAAREISGNDTPSTATPLATNNSESFHLVSDVLDITIAARGGDVVQALLLEHFQDLDSGRPIELLYDNSNRTYIAQSGLVGTNGTDTAEGRPLFSASTDRRELAPGADSISLDLVYETTGARIIKRFTLNRGDYYVKVDYLVENTSDSEWSASFYAQFKRDSYVPPTASMMGAKPFIGAAITTPENRYQKFDFKDLDNESFQERVDTGWVAFLQHYYLGAWVPDSSKALDYNLRSSASTPYYYAGFSQTALSLAPGETGEINAGLYVGPKDQYRLKDIALHLDLTIDYGWIWWAAQPIYAILYFLHSGEYNLFGSEGQLFGGVGNWGIAIILLTLIVKLAFFKLSAASYKSMAKMRKLQPKLASLKERYGDDKQQFSQEMMRMYQKEKVNPMGGCLPMLVQMPVFIALYWVLLESVEIRHEPFFGWIVDLSAKDPWFILPLIMGVSMWFQMRLNPAPPDPTQAKVMQMMPFFFTFMFMWFPAGLVLYWCSNNILSITQQFLITRSIEKADNKAAS